MLFGFGEQAAIITTFPFAVWIIIPNARAGVMQIPPSRVEVACSFGASNWQAFSSISLGAARPEILAGVRIGVIRGVKGVIIGQRLVSVLGFGQLFEICASNFPMLHFWSWSSLRSASPEALPGGSARSITTRQTARDVLFTSRKDRQCPPM